MYVKKFEGDNLDEALKAIKAELGPDAIILKTVTNKGLKGALKKKKIEITAAISEKNYAKKATVDRSLNDEQKNEFYSSKASAISKRIDGHTQNKGYGSMGLNKVVQTTKNKIVSGLDDFLGKAEEKTDVKPNFNPASFLNQEENLVDENIFQANSFQKNTPVASTLETENAEVPSMNAFEDELHQQQVKIAELEQKLFEMTQRTEQPVIQDNAGENGIRSLVLTLKSLDLEEKNIQEIVKKASFELTPEELKDDDQLFEFALRELENRINIAMPLFSSSEAENGSVTVLLSDSASGQSSSLLKLGSLKENSVLIQYGQSIEKGGVNIPAKIFGLNLNSVDTIAEIVSECRKGLEQGKTIFIDYRNSKKDLDETRKFIEGLRRGFNNVEVLVTLSAVHSELYNRKTMNKFIDLCDGVIINHLDLCLNYGSLLNVHYSFNEKPLKFFGTGEVVPEDIESASTERLLSGMFKFN